MKLITSLILVFLWIAIMLNTSKAAKTIYNDQITFGTTGSTSNRIIQFGQTGSGCIRFVHGGEVQFSDDCTSWHDLLDSTELDDAIESKIQDAVTGTADYVAYFDEANVINSSSVSTTELELLGGMSGTLATLLGTETFTNKTFDDALTIKEISTPSNPASGYQKLYFDSTYSNLYRVDSAGVTKQVGGSGAGGDADTVTYFQMKDKIIGDFTTGNNATFGTIGTATGVLSLSTTATDLIDETQSLKYVGTSDANDWFSYTVDLPLNSRGKYLGFAFQYKNDANADDDSFDFCIKQIDGSKAGVECFDIDAFKSSNDSIKFTANSFIWNDCTQIAIGFHNKDAVDANIIIDNVLVTRKVFNEVDLIEHQSLSLYGVTTKGTTDTKILRFNSIAEDEGSGLIERVSTAANGDTFTAIKDIFVTITLIYGCTLSSAQEMGLSRNSTQLTTDINGINQTNILGMTRDSESGNISVPITWSGKLSKGDVVRAHVNSAGIGSLADTYSISILATGEKSAVINKSNGLAKESFIATYQANFWDTTGDVYTWDEALLVPAITTSDYISISDDASKTKIYAKQDTLINISFTASFATGSSYIYNSSDVIISLGSSERYLSASLILKKDDYIYLRSNNSNNRDGNMAITAESAYNNPMFIVPSVQTCYVDVHATYYTSGFAATTSYKVGNLDRLSGDCGFASIDSDQLTLQKGKYEIEVPVGAYNGPLSVHLLIYEVGVGNLFEYLEVVYSNTNAISHNTIKETLNFTSTKTIDFRTKSVNASGNEYLGRIKITKLMSY